jgi:hypothetical protein
VERIEPDRSGGHPGDSFRPARGWSGTVGQISERVQYRAQGSSEVPGLAEVAHVRAGQLDDSGSKMGGEPLRCFVSPVAGSRAVAVAGARRDCPGHPYRCELAAVANGTATFRAEPAVAMIDPAGSCRNATGLSANSFHRTYCGPTHGTTKGTGAAGTG